MKYFVSFSIFTSGGGRAFDSTIMETDYKIDTEETLYSLQEEIGKWKAGNISSSVTILFFKEIEGK